MSPKCWITIASVSGFLSVAFGAFGAHALRASLDPRALEIYQTAVHYQMFHSLALLAVGLLGLTKGSVGTSFGAGPSAAALAFSGWALSIGILVFSGSLYALALSDLRWLGAITPLGGVAFLAGWAALAWSAWKSHA